MGMGWLGRISHNPLLDYLCKNGKGDLSACYPNPSCFPTNDSSHY